MMEEIAPAPKQEDARWPIKGTQTGFQVAPLEELWKSVPKASGRI
jgi:hypothetical protein